MPRTLCSAPKAVGEPSTSPTTQTGTRHRLTRHTQSRPCVGEEILPYQAHALARIIFFIKNSPVVHSSPGGAACSKGTHFVLLMRLGPFANLLYVEITLKRVVRPSAGADTIYPPFWGLICVGYPKGWYRMCNPM